MTRRRIPQRKLSRMIQPQGRPSPVPARKARYPPYYVILLLINTTVIYSSRKSSHTAPHHSGSSPAASSVLPFPSPIISHFMMWAAFCPLSAFALVLLCSSYPVQPTLLRTSVCSYVRESHDGVPVPCLDLLGNSIAIERCSGPRGGCCLALGKQASKTPCLFRFVVCIVVSCDSIMRFDPCNLLLFPSLCRYYCLLNP